MREGHRPAIDGARRDDGQVQEVVQHHSVARDRSRRHHGHERGALVERKVHSKKGGIDVLTARAEASASFDT